MSGVGTGGRSDSITIKDSKDRIQGLFLDYSLSQVGDSLTDGRVLFLVSTDGHRRSAGILIDDMVKLSFLTPIPRSQSRKKLPNLSFSTVIWS